MPTLNDVLAGSQAQAVQVQQIIDALKGTPNKGVPVALVSLNDPNNYALTVQNDDPVNSRALSVLKADGTTLISADATGVTLGAPVNLPPGSISGTAIAAGSITNAMLGADVARANLLTNGGFEQWQRGAGPFTANNGFTCDRWQHSLAGTDTLSVSKDTANVDTGSLADAVCTFGLGTGAGSSSWIQTIRLSEGNQLAGRQISLSIRVRTATANAVRIAIGGDGTGAAFLYSTFHTGSGAYQTLTSSGYTVPTNATVVYVAVFFAASCTAYVDNAMLVVGSQAANYVPMHPADDLARGLRYYEILGETASSLIISQNNALAGGVIRMSVLFKARKAVVPTVTKVGTWTVTNCAQPTAVSPGVDGCYLSITATAGAADTFAFNAANCLVSLEANP